MRSDGLIIHARRFALALGVVGFWLANRDPERAVHDLEAIRARYDCEAALGKGQRPSSEMDEASQPSSTPAQLSLAPAVSEGQFAAAVEEARRTFAEQVHQDAIGVGEGLRRRGGEVLGGRVVRFFIRAKVANTAIFEDPDAILPTHVSDVPIDVMAISRLMTQSNCPRVTRLSERTTRFQTTAQRTDTGRDADIGGIEPPGHSWCPGNGRKRWRSRLPDGGVYFRHQPPR